MTNGSQIQTSETTEILARFMDWEIGDGWLYDAANRVTWLYSTDDPTYYPWAPFTDANADLQVLQRVREVWGEGTEWNGDAWTRGSRFAIELQRQLQGAWEDSDARHLWQSCFYAVGMYSRAALAVLREMETEG